MASVDDLDTALKRWGRDLGVGSFQPIEHVPFDSFVLTVDGQRYEDVVFDHSAAFAAWGPIVVELNEVHAIDDRLAAAYGLVPGAVSHVSWVVPDAAEESARLAGLGCRLINTARSGPISVAWHDGGPLFPHPIEVHQHNDVIAGMHGRLAALRADDERLRWRATVNFMGDGGLAVTAAAAVQRRLWGTDPRAWADLAEAHNRPLFEAVLDAARIGRGTRVLDVGCGSGLALVLAARRGAVPSGLDISPGLLGIARDRLPDADLREGDMESLPFADTAFDAVLGVNVFQFAGDPRRALRAAARVVRPGGRVVASLFAEPKRSEGTVVHEAMSALIPPGQTGDHAPYALSAPGNLEAALADAGLRVMGHGEVARSWRYASLDDAVEGLLCSAGGARAREAAGERTVRDVLQRALAQFQDPQTAVVTMENTFRWVTAGR